MSCLQVPGAVCLTDEEWGPESGLVTAAMKLKRRPLQVDLHHHSGCLRIYWRHISWPCLCHISNWRLFWTYFWWRIVQERYQEDINRMYGHWSKIRARKTDDEIFWYFLEDLVSHHIHSPVELSEVTSAQAIKGRVSNMLTGSSST